MDQDSKIAVSRELLAANLVPKVSEFRNKCRSFITHAGIQSKSLRRMCISAAAFLTLKKFWRQTDTVGKLVLSFSHCRLGLNLYSLPTVNIKMRQHIYFRLLQNSDGASWLSVRTPAEPWEDLLKNLPKAEAWNPHLVVSARVLKIL